MLIPLKDPVCVKLTVLAFKVTDVATDTSIEESSVIVPVACSEVKVKLSPPFTIQLCTAWVSASVVSSKVVSLEPKLAMAVEPNALSERDSMSPHLMSA